MPSFVSLNLNKDFLRLYHRGKSCAGSALVVYAMKNRTGLCRAGITTSKKIGNAVERNKSRRLIRAAFQNVYREYEDCLQGYDIVFVARGRTRYRKSYDLEKIMVRHLRKGNVLPKNGVKEKR